MAKTKVQVIFYSTYGHVYRLAEAIAEGAPCGKTEVEVLQVGERSAQIVDPYRSQASVCLGSSRHSR